MSGGLAGGIGDLGGPHSLDQTQISYAGNVAQQAGYLAAGGLGNIAGIGPFGPGGVASEGGLPGQAGQVAGLYGLHGHPTAIVGAANNGGGEIASALGGELFIISVQKRLFTDFFIKKMFLNFFCKFSRKQVLESLFNRLPGPLLGAI